jgi:phage terminase large subunit
MIQQVSEIYKPLFTENPRYFILMGGRGAGRSTVASQFANAKLLAPDYFRCAIMRYVLGDIRNSIFREITDRLEENDIEDKVKIADMTIEYGENSINAVGFKKSSGDQKSKLKSLASYNCVIIEEADEVTEEDFTQLDDSLRTVKGDITIILLLNPPSKDHWIIQRWFTLEPSGVPGFYIPQLKPELDDTIAIRADYHSNEQNIAPASIRQYESYKTTKPSHYYNMIKGYVPETVQGIIYPNFQIIDELPSDARLKRRGLDYGYTNDPSAIVDVYTWNNGFIWDEVMYKRGMSNKEIADVIKMQPEQVLLIPDSSEPKSNDELMSYGINLVPAQKGQGSVNQGIQHVQEQTIHITRRSFNIIKEKNNYAWIVNKSTGETINTPIDMNNHAMDAGRYAMESLQPNEQAAHAYKPQSMMNRKYQRSKN